MVSNDQIQLGSLAVIEYWWISLFYGHCALFLQSIYNYLHIGLLCSFLEVHWYNTSLIWNWLGVAIYNVGWVLFWIGYGSTGLLGHRLPRISPAAPLRVEMEARRKDGFWGLASRAVLSSLISGLSNSCCSLSRCDPRWLWSSFWGENLCCLVPPRSSVDACPSSRSGVKIWVLVYAVVRIGFLCFLSFFLPYWCLLRRLSFCAIYPRLPCSFSVSSLFKNSSFTMSFWKACLFWFFQVLIICHFGWRDCFGDYMFELIWFWSLKIDRLAYVVANGEATAVWHFTLEVDLVVWLWSAVGSASSFTDSGENMVPIWSTRMSSASVII